MLATRLPKQRVDRNKVLLLLLLILLLTVQTFGKRHGMGESQRDRETPSSEGSRIGRIYGESDYLLGHLIPSRGTFVRTVCEKYPVELKDPVKVDDGFVITVGFQLYDWMGCAPYNLLTIQGDGRCRMVVHDRFPDGGPFENPLQKQFTVPKVVVQQLAQLVSQQGVYKLNRFYLAGVTHGTLAFFLQECSQGNKLIEYYETIPKPLQPVLKFIKREIVDKFSKKAATKKRLIASEYKTLLPMFAGSYLMSNEKPFIRARFNDTSLPSFVAALKDIRSLDLTGTQVTPAGIRQLPVMPRLDTLKLDVTAVDRSLLETIDRLPSLADLSVTCIRTDEKLNRNIPNCSQLKQLSIGHSVVTKGMVDHLKSLSLLPGLSIHHSSIEQDALVALSGLTHIKYMSIPNNDRADHILKHVKEMKNLEEIVLKSSIVSDVGIAYLRGLPKLRKLLLDDTDITDRSLEHIGEFPSLKYLEIMGTKATLEGVRQLKKQKPLLVVVD